MLLTGKYDRVGSNFTRIKITKDLEVRRDLEKPGQPGQKHVSMFQTSSSAIQGIINTNSVKVNR